MWSILSTPLPLEAAGDPSPGSRLRPRYRTVNVPNYLSGELEDSVDLQIKSLLYVFRRLSIERLKPFLRPSTGRHSLAELEYWNASSSAIPYDYIHNARLDEIYNVARFKEQLLDDPYRVLIDYPKNKFRAMLLLSGPPCELDTLPELNAAQHFGFEVLRPEDPEERYIEVLVDQSGIYCEHHVSRKLRVRILRSALARQQEQSLAVQQTLGKDDRAAVVCRYVQKLAMHIQVERIYRATLKAKKAEAREALLGFATKKTIQPYNELFRQRSQPILKDSTNKAAHYDSSKAASIANLAIVEQSSPKKQTRPPSVDYEKVSPELDLFGSDTNSDTHLRASDSESPTSSMAANTSFSKFFSPEEKAVFYEQSKMAVRIRIERERMSLV